MDRLHFIIYMNDEGRALLITVLLTVQFSKLSLTGPESQKASSTQHPLQSAMYMCLKYNVFPRLNVLSLSTSRL